MPSGGVSAYSFLLSKNGDAGRVRAATQLGSASAISMIDDLAPMGKPVPEGRRPKAFQNSAVAGGRMEGNRDAERAYCFDGFRLLPGRFWLFRVVGPGRLG